jgi:hypothetical protein
MWPSCSTKKCLYLLVFYLPIGTTQGGSALIGRLMPKQTSFGQDSTLLLNGVEAAGIEEGSSSSYLEIYNIRALMALLLLWLYFRLLGLKWLLYNVRSASSAVMPSRRTFGKHLASAPLASLQAERRQQDGNIVDCTADEFRERHENGGPILRATQ